LARSGGCQSSASGRPPRLESIRLRIPPFRFYFGGYHSLPVYKLN
jgi:hypothetical protein